ncbi:hypothetical protein OG589_14405 [Sphaerisporangium sp. NBC_01403]
MKVRVNVTVALITCKRCGADHNNPLTHACLVTMAELGKPASMRKKTKR